MKSYHVEIYQEAAFKKSALFVYARIVFRAHFSELCVELGNGTVELVKVFTRSPWRALHDLNHEIHKQFRNPCPTIFAHLGDLGRDLAANMLQDSGQISQDRRISSRQRNFVLIRPMLNHLPTKRNQMLTLFGIFKYYVFKGRHCILMKLT